MELNFLSRLLFSFLLLTIFSSFSSSSFISDGVFESQRLVIGRNLLQTPKACPVNFEFQNYTVLTSQCKGPNYPPKECCAAFKNFACPYVDELNDGSTNCAATMFTYINLYGKYPSGLFANQCKEGKQGLECPALPPAIEADANAATTASSRLWLAPSAAFLGLVSFFWGQECQISAAYS